jgi:type I restriction enzyme S subunit
MDKQLEIVELLNTINKDIKDIDDKYQAKLDSLEELKKSILQKAFSGEFTQKEVVI